MIAWFLFFSFVTLGAVLSLTKAAAENENEPAWQPPPTPAPMPGPPAPKPEPSAECRCFYCRTLQPLPQGWDGADLKIGWLCGQKQGVSPNGG